MLWRGRVPESNVQSDLPIMVTSPRGTDQRAVSICPGRPSTPRRSGLCRAVPANHGRQGMERVTPSFDSESNAHVDKDVARRVKTIADRVNPILGVWAAGGIRQAAGRHACSRNQYSGLRRGPRHRSRSKWMGNNAAPSGRGCDCRSLRRLPLAPAPAFQEQSLSRDAEEPRGLFDATVRFFEGVADERLFEFLDRGGQRLIELEPNLGFCRGVSAGDRAA